MNEKYSVTKQAESHKEKAAEEKDRILYLDFLKFIATFFVLSYHFSMYSFNFIESGSALHYVYYLCRTILSTCVPIFFFVNGNLLFDKPLVLKKHIFRTLRYIGLVFVWCAVYILLILLFANDGYSMNDIASAFLNLDQAFGINILWYLGALVCIYILFPALKALFDTSKSGFLFFTVSCAVFTIGFGFINDILTFAEVLINRILSELHLQVYTLENEIFEMFNPFRGSFGYTVVYFCVGGLVRQHLRQILSVPTARRNATAFLCMTLSCTLLFLQGVFYSRYVDNSIWRIVWNGYDTVFTFINVLALFVLSLNYEKNNAFINAVSRHTLGIYLIHILIGATMTSVLMRYVSFTYLYQNILFTLCLLSVCLVLCMGMKKIPLLKHLI